MVDLLTLTKNREINLHVRVELAPCSEQEHFIGFLNAVPIKQPKTARAFRPCVVSDYPSSGEPNIKLYPLATVRVR